jgi:hypothetical protein
MWLAVLVEAEKVTTLHENKEKKFNSIGRALATCPMGISLPANSGLASPLSECR